MGYLSWHVGMKVVCIKPDYDPEPPDPVFGHVYTISWVGADDGDVLIDLEELPNPDSEDYFRGYFAAGFRPVQPRKTDISIFTALLHGKRAKVDA